MIFNMCFDGTLFPTTLYFSLLLSFYSLSLFHSSGLHLVSLFPWKSRASSSGSMRPGSVPRRIVMGYGFFFYFLFVLHWPYSIMFRGVLHFMDLSHVLRSLSFFVSPAAVFTLISFFLILHLDLHSTACSALKTVDGFFMDSCTLRPPYPDIAISWNRVLFETSCLTAVVHGHSALPCTWPVRASAHHVITSLARLYFAKRP